MSPAELRALLESRPARSSRRAVEHECERALAEHGQLVFRCMAQSECRVALRRFIWWCSGAAEARRRMELLCAEAVRGRNPTAAVEVGAMVGWDEEPPLFCVFSEEIDSYGSDFARLCLEESSGLSNGRWAVCASLRAEVETRMVDAGLRIVREEFESERAMNAAHAALKLAFKELDDDDYKFGKGTEPLGTSATCRIDVEPIFQWPADLIPRRPVRAVEGDELFGGAHNIGKGYKFGILRNFKFPEISAARKIRPDRRTFIHLMMEDREADALRAMREGFVPGLCDWTPRELVLGLGLCELAKGCNLRGCVRVLLGIGDGEGATAWTGKDPKLLEHEEGDRGDRLAFTLVAALSTWFFGEPERAREELVRAFGDLGASDRLLQRAKATLEVGDWGRAPPFDLAEFHQAEVVQVKPSTTRAEAEARFGVIDDADIEPDSESEGGDGGGGGG